MGLCSQYNRAHIRPANRILHGLPFRLVFTGHWGSLHATVDGRPLRARLVEHLIDAHKPAFLANPVHFRHRADVEDEEDVSPQQGHTGSKTGEPIGRNGRFYWLCVCDVMIRGRPLTTAGTEVHREDLLCDPLRSLWLCFSRGVRRGFPAQR